MRTKADQNTRINVVISFLAIIMILVTIIASIIALNESELLVKVSVSCLIILLFSMLYIYMYFFNKELFHQRNKLLLFACIYVILMIVVVAMNKLPYFLIPISIAGMLIAIMIDNRLGIMTNMILTILGLLVSGKGMNFFVFYMISGTISCLIITQAKKRNKIVFVAGYLSIINVIIVILLNLYYFGNFSQLNVTDIFYSVLNAIFSVIITVGSLPLWETLFDVSTPLKLLELTNSDQKLIQRLLLEAPGTYHHSQMVSNLAQTAANDIGANALLARTGALYHDIGKLKNPMYFTENQDGTNPHDELDPVASAKIIINHVADGVKLATDNHLPKAIRNIIREHQGDTLVKYFYFKAKDNKEDIDEDDFRYRGPKPQTNEAAIIMLADCAEAYIRSLQESKRTLSNIEKCIKEIINDKFAEGQLSECDLKIKELPVIADSFMKVYNGLYHERVKYPNKEIGGNKHVNNNK